MRFGKLHISPHCQLSREEVNLEIWLHSIATRYQGSPCLLAESNHHGNLHYINVIQESCSDLFVPCAFDASGVLSNCRTTGS